MMNKNNRERTDAAAAVQLANPVDRSSDPLKCSICGRTCRNKGGLTSHEKACRAKQPGLSVTKFKCSCGVEFDMEAGLGLHRRRNHEAEYFAEQRVSVKARWTSNEVHLLALEEAKLTLSGAQINEGLARVFIGRTLEGIKGQRKKPEYKRKVIRLVEELRNSVEDEEEELEEENGPNQELQDIMDNAVLHPILKGTTLGSIAEKAANYVDTLLPNQPAKPAKGKPGQKMPTGRKKQRRILYASAQDLYRKDKGKLLELIEEDNLQ